MAIVEEDISKDKTNQFSMLLIYFDLKIFLVQTVICAGIT